MLVEEINVLPSITLTCAVALGNLITAIPLNRIPSSLSIDQTICDAKKIIMAELVDPANRRISQEVQKTGASERWTLLHLREMLSESIILHAFDHLL